jgi:hypothetical protein
MALSLCGEGRWQTISTSVSSYKQVRVRLAYLVTLSCDYNLGGFSSIFPGRGKVERIAGRFLR